MQKINRDDLNSEQLPDWAEFERTAEDETVIRAKTGFKNVADQADLADLATEATHAVSADPPFVTFVGSGATRKELTLEAGTLSLYAYPAGGSRGALISSIAYNSTIGKLVASGVQTAEYTEVAEFTSATLTAGKTRGTSAIASGKMFLPSYGAADMDVVTLSTMAKTSVALTTAQSYDAPGLVVGSYVYFAPTAATKMLRVTIANNAVAEYDVLSNHARLGGCAVGTKLYYPQSGGTNLDVYDTADNTKATVAGFTNGDKYAIFHYAGKLYMPISGTTTMDIYDITSGVKTTAVIANATRRCGTVYGTKLFMPVLSGTTMYIFDLLTNPETTTAVLASIASRYDCAALGKYLVIPQNPGINIDIYDMELNVARLLINARNYTKNSVSANSTTVYFPESGGTKCDSIAISETYSDTGTGIADRGSNTNGLYVKFSDGTMICWASIAVSSIPANSESDVTPALYVPAAFYSVSTGAATLQPSASWNGFSAFGGMKDIDEWYIHFKNGNTAQTCTAQCIAIGRWKA